MDVAGQLKEVTAALGIPFIFKSSYDKANRSSGKSYRGPGMEKGLEILAKVRKTLGVPILTDVHTEAEVPTVAGIVDVLQTPAFLCRQTDFIHAVASAGKPVNIKKGQFLAPGDMKNVVDKAREASGADNIMVCERGASFGYNNLVSDMRSLAIMRDTGCPVVFDATHSVQLPGGQGLSSGGQREFIPVLASRAARSLGGGGGCTQEFEAEFTRRKRWRAGRGNLPMAAIIGAAVDDLPAMRRLVVTCTRITHADPKAEHGALAVALAAHL